MQNEKKTNTGNVDPHNPQKKGESGAINKLSENEDENADDTCGCGSPHASTLDEPNKGTEGRRLEDRDETDNEDPSANPNRKPATAQQGQNKVRSGPQQGDIGNLNADQNQNRPAQQSDQNRRPYDPNMQSGSVNQGQNAPPRAGQPGQDTLNQNRPAKADEFTHNPNKQNDLAKQGRNAQNQNVAGEEMHESEDETAPENRIQDADMRQGSQRQNAQNLPRSRRQLGDPDDEVSAETRRKEDLAEEAEKSGANDAPGSPQK